MMTNNDCLVEYTNILASCIIQASTLLINDSCDCVCVHECVHVRKREIGKRELVLIDLHVHLNFYG